MSENKITNHGSYWIIDCAPHVAMRIKRLFPSAVARQGQIILSKTTEHAYDLEWFFIRFPFSGDIEDVVSLSKEYQQRKEKVHSVLSGERKVRKFDLRLPLREYQKTSAELALTMGRLLITDDVGLGKAQPINAQVLTPYGWCKIGDLKVGDPVVDPDGGFAEVTGVFPQGVIDTFRVSFSDGASTVCCDDHLWLVQTGNDRGTNSHRVLPLHEIRRNLRYSSGQFIGRYFVPLPKPVEFLGSNDPEIDPYLLGFLLSYGFLREGCLHFVAFDDDILIYLRESLPSGSLINHVGGPNWYITGDLTTRFSELRCFSVYKEFAEKFIPEEALYASVSYRKKLLQGLLDSAGRCTNGTIIFNTPSSCLRDGIIDLVRSLGGVATCHTQEADTYTFRINLRLPFNPFRSTRKAVLWRSPYMAKRFKDVSYSGRSESVCIAVSTKRSLYITDGYTVTHNTAQAIAMLAGGAPLPALVVTLTHLTYQWKREIEKFAPQLNTHVIKTGKNYDLTKYRGKDVPEPDVIIINYAKLAKWEHALAGKVKTFILDEVQELRRTESKKYFAAQSFRNYAEVRCGLSATPIANYGEEFYNVFDILDPDALGTRSEFLGEWCSSSIAMGKARIKDPEAFGSYLRSEGMMVRRTREEVGRELESLSKIPVEIETDTKEIDKVKGTARELAQTVLTSAGLGRGEKMQAAEELTNILRQATGVAKAPHVADFVRNIVESGESVVLYGWHHLAYDIWMSKLKDLNPLLYTGKQSASAKEASAREFKEGKSKILIMSLRSGAGLDGLQDVCRTVVFGELDWSPATHLQCAGRIHRDGQLYPVMAYYLLANGGIDPIMADVLGVKTGQLDPVLNPSHLAGRHDVGDTTERLAEYVLNQ